MTPREKLVEAMISLREDPLGYVMFNFPWDSERSIQVVKLADKYRERFNCEYGPDVWACEFLDELGEDIKSRGFDGRTPVEPIRYTTASGHGIGKSAIAAWMSKFILDCYPLSKGTLTANTAEQLKTKTWAEIGKWHNLSLTRDWFTYNATRGNMSLVSVEAPTQWRLDAVTCRKENSEAFHGQHAPTGCSFYIFDEASGIDSSIFVAREGGITDGLPIVLDFGNPTRNSGSFYENCVGRSSHRYKFRSIDSRTAALPNKAYLAEMIADNGIDSDHVKVKILGQFPSAGSIQFIGHAEVQMAIQRELVEDKRAPLIIGVDVARFGTNETVIYPRLGMDARSFPVRRYNGLSVDQVVGKVIETLTDFRKLGRNCAALFIDEGGVGGGPLDMLRMLGYTPIGVNFGGRPINSQVYRFRSDEMWGRMRESIRTGLLLPDMPELVDQLTQREYGYTIAGNKITLESKKDMATRLGSGASPDIADALALTFAQDVFVELEEERRVTVKHDYNPLTVNF